MTDNTTSEQRQFESTPVHDGHRIYLDAPFIPKKVCVSVEGKDFWYEPDASCDYLMRKLSEAMVERDALRDALRVVAFNEEDLLASEIAEMAAMILRQSRAREAESD